MNSSEALTSNRKSATTDWATLVLLVKGNIGPGCLAMPYIFSMLGPVWSVPALLGVALVCVYNMWLLAQCKKRVDGAKTYGELGLAAFGRTGELVVELFLIAMQLSICCVYFSFIGDSLFPLFGVDKKIVTVALIFPVLLITQLRHMRQLAPLSLIAFVCLAVAMLMIVSVCVERIYEEAPSVKHPYQSSVLMLFFVSTVYAFEGIGIVLPIEESMQSPNNFSFILCVAMVVVITVYILFAEVVLMAFGEIDDAGITGFLEGQGSISPLVSGSISILISLAVFLSYPLQLYPALQVIEIYCGYTGDRAAYSSKTCWVQWLCCDCIADNTMSYTPSEDSKYKSPEYKRRRPRWKRIRYSFDFDGHAAGEDRPLFSVDERMYGVGSSDYSDSGLSPNSLTYDNKNKSCTNSSDEISMYLSSPSTAGVHGGYAARSFSSISEKARSGRQGTHYVYSHPPDADPYFDDAVEFNPWFFPRSTVRVVVVISTAVVATLVPDVGLLVSLAGASSGTALALILPPTLDIAISYLQKSHISSIRLAFNIVSIAFGVFGAFVGTLLSVKDIYRKYGPNVLG